MAGSGYDRCVCGNKYFENDKCIDCTRHISEIPVCPGVDCTEILGGMPCFEHESSAETGAAEVRIALHQFKILVHHADGTLLGQKLADKGDWSRLIDFLKDDLGIEWQVED
jgi:hypothetical protein